MNDTAHTRDADFGKIENEAAAPEFERSWAVVIGIDDYKNGIKPLKTATGDAVRLAQILKDEQSFEIWPPGTNTPLLNKAATKSELNTLLTKTLPNEIGKNDRLLFYFAGHGVADEDNDGLKGYLVPQNADPDNRDTFLSMQTLSESLLTLKCRHLLVILDCCFAGALRWSSTRDVPTLPDLIHRERFERFIQDPAWQVIASAAYDQKALDVLAGDTIGVREARSKQSHSPFALALFKALEDGEADAHTKSQPKGDGVITATELYFYLRNAVEPVTESQNHRQTPSFWSMAKHDKGEFIFLVPGHHLNLPKAEELTQENNPYRGLQAFEEKHQDIFFGRDELIDQLEEQVSNHPLTIVIGASGSGKSSLVKAGLLPRLRRSEQPGWHIMLPPPQQTGAGSEGTALSPPMRPANSPLHILERVIKTSLSLPNQPLDFSILPKDEDSQALARLIESWVAVHPGQKLLLVVDQFEELITLCRDEKERKQFVQLLVVALQTQAERFRLVLTLRSDFEPQLVQLFLEIPEQWVENRFFVSPMNRAEYRAAIEGPAATRVLFFEPSDLINRIVDEVVSTRHGLPLLSFTLRELYQKYIKSGRRNRALVEADYKALGGVIGSLRSRATAEYETLDQAHQQTMRRIMLRMIFLDGNKVTRRRVTGEELIYSTPAENERGAAVIERLTEARLIVADKTEGTAYWEPTHDALINAWDKLSTWVNNEKDNKTDFGTDLFTLQNRLAQAAIDWHLAETDEKKRGLLWDNHADLSYVEKSLTGHPTLWLNQIEVGFIEAGLEQRRLNEATLAEARSNQLAAQSQIAGDPTGSLNLMLAREAVQSTCTPLSEADATLRSVVVDASKSPWRQTIPWRTHHCNSVWSVAFSPDSTRIVSGSADCTVRLWDAQRGQPLGVPLTGHSGTVTSARLSHKKSS